MNNNSPVTIAYEKFRIARKQFEENLDQRSAKHSEKAQSEYFKLIQEKGEADEIN